MYLDAADMQDFLSPYLDHGYKQDRIALRDVEVLDDHARASLDVIDYFPPGDGAYHFTSLHAMIVVSQLGIVLACRSNGFHGKPGEIYMRDFSIVCRRKIQKVSDITFSLALRRSVQTRTEILYAIDYQFEAQAFTGRLRCLFPRGKSEPRE